MLPDGNVLDCVLYYPKAVTGLKLFSRQVDFLMVELKKAVLIKIHNSMGSCSLRN